MCAKKFKLIHRASKGTGLCSGKEEFCLPTKLQVPRADVCHVHVQTLRQRAQRLRLIRAREPIAARQRNRDAYAHSVGDLKHRLTVRLTDEHVAHLNEIANASGLKRNEVMRRLLLSQEIPSAEERRDIQQILRVQKEQNRLGGLLKKALTEREEKASLRQTLAEIERNAAELRRLIAYIRGLS